MSASESLFNRLRPGKKLALVDNTPGVTRDRRVLIPARLYDLNFDVVDTAGFEDAAAKSIPGRMREQTGRAVDARLRPDSVRHRRTRRGAARRPHLRRSGAPGRQAGGAGAANKSEARRRGALLEAWELGLGTPVAISTEHGQGLPDLRNAVVEALGEAHILRTAPAEEAQPAADQTALLGDDVEDPMSKPAYN